MIDLDIILLISGLLIFAFSIYLFVSTIIKSDDQSSALAWASGEKPVQSKSPVINFSRNLVHNFALQYVSKIKNPAYRAKVEKKILSAGLSDELNVDEYIGLQVLWGVMFPILLLILNFALQLGFSTYTCLGLGLLGLMFPHLYCQSNKGMRYTAVIIEMPFFVDLLALSTEAGLDFVNAIQRITEKLGDSVLSSELNIVLKDIKLGSSRADALRNLSKRLDIPEVTSFSSVIIDADDTGASIAKVLKDQSEQMRLERFVRAEKAGARASQQILIPMMVFILPAVFIMVFAPMAIEFYYGGGG